MEQAIEQVKRIHQVIVGTSSRGVPYDAEDPALSAWVHNALTDSFLVANQLFGAGPLDEYEANQFVAEQRRVGALLDADPMPETASELSAWLEGHPWIAPSPEMEDAVSFLVNPPLDVTVKPAYGLLIQGAIATIPERIRSVLGLEPRIAAVPVAKSLVTGLRWVMGYSPSWRLALMRVGAPIPEGLFVQRPIQAPDALSPI